MRRFSEIAPGNLRILRTHAARDHSLGNMPIEQYNELAKCFDEILRITNGVKPQSAHKEENEQRSEDMTPSRRQKRERTVVA